MYGLIEKKLNHYHHYEISNFALTGYESKHNLTYWKNEEYYGFGSGSSGYVDDVRYTNTKSIKHYLEEYKRIEEKRISLKEKIENEFILGFRILDGISITNFEKKYGKNPIHFKAVKDFIDKNMLEVRGNFLRIPKDYIYISNEILVSFIDCQEDF